ncbi:uncharacterized protein (DUF2235 family) [Saccharothrix tamanrassetensis]|uniref:Uncharacterized protein (DUF2235 family) n=1 Tax=Saccharothrix tamanrassetensis TaxID=1051531 RepID=A0A841CTJ1_9PSEU|nr:DUF2235 domain-containing protein [Saccharothrix tamanrassetensis]MBB5960619.1 uncharacterized protein (DUF2235 family) [Saccharothrix tamanrassetensis]
MSVPDRRNLALCLDGTCNEPEPGDTNVARLYDIAVKSDRQLVYYDPGVGTMDSRSATTRPGKALTRVTGMVIGHAVRKNVQGDYGFLMNTYLPGDRVFVFGLSKDAYTARAYDPEVVRAVLKRLDAAQTP